MPADEPASPEEVRYDLDEALTLLGALEDGRDALIDSGHLAVVVGIETEIRVLSRKLGFDDPAGGCLTRHYVHSRSGFVTLNWKHLPNIAAAKASNESVACAYRTTHPGR